MEIENRLERRFLVLQKLDYYITESVYYRTHKEDVDLSNPMTLWTYDEEDGIIDLYENI